MTFSTLTTNKLQTTPGPDGIPVDYLIIGGGGGAGWPQNAAGGGGAGGYRCSVVGEMSGGGQSAEPTILCLSGISYTVTVGEGGAAAVASETSGAKGADSLFRNITAYGGGGGGGGYLNTNGNATSGASGGGGWAVEATNTAGAAAYTPLNQGYAGGASNTVSSYGRGGGGGGAGAVGAGGTASGNGGVGIASSITGTSVFRAGGGGGGSDSRNGLFGGAGGNGGGGTGGGTGTTSTVGTPNTGGGGGGGGLGSSSRAGGSGVVILRFSNLFTASVSGGLTYTISTAVTGKKIYIFTAGTGTIFF